MQMLWTDQLAAVPTSVHFHFPAFEISSMLEIESKRTKGRKPSSKGIANIAERSVSDAGTLLQAPKRRRASVREEKDQRQWRLEERYR